MSVWSKTQPTEPGYYWCRTTNTGGASEPIIARIHGGFVETFGSVEHWHDYELEAYGFEFGPPVKPLDP